MEDGDHSPLWSFLIPVIADESKTNLQMFFQQKLLLNEASTSFEPLFHNTSDIAIYVIIISTHGRFFSQVDGKTAQFVHFWTRNLNGQFNWKRKIT